MDAPSKFFFGLEQKNGQKRFMHTVWTESGDLLSEPAEICKWTVSFFSKLYDSEQSGAPELEESFPHKLPKLTRRSAETLDRALSLDELYTALQGVENGRAPGIDGLPVEFYKSFWLLGLKTGLSWSPPEEGPVLPAIAEAPGRVEHADAAAAEEFAAAGPAAEEPVAAQRPDTVRGTHGSELQDGCGGPAEDRAPALQEGIAMETDPVFKTPVKRKKGGVRSAASKQAKQGERGDDTDTDDGQSDSGCSMSSQEDTSSTVYTAEDIKAFLQRTKGQKLVQVAECISDWSQFVHDVGHFRREKAFTELELYRLKKLLTRLRRDGTEDGHVLG
ncbi:hypothetical protein NFI96_008702 [Prochilodus magdalenae]|nr:hypothetical protein NFI96_008702 [Prochilodus magdalenae]